MKRLDGEVAIVAGGGRGFGRSIAVALAEQGAAVCLTSRTAEQLQETSSTIRLSGGSVCHVAADLTSRSDIEGVVAETLKTFGPATILVFAAAVPGPFGPLWITDPDSWWSAMTLHIRAPVLLLRQVLPEMIKRERGRAVLLSSPAGVGGSAFLSPYCLGKTAQIRLAALVDRETREFGVRVFAINPGLAFTQLAADTVGDPTARQFLPGMVERLSALSLSDASDSVLRSCADRCLQLASGRYDALGGYFLDTGDDLDKLLEQQGALHESARIPPQPP